jgi:hypothetical protein
MEFFACDAMMYAYNRAKDEVKAVCQGDEGCHSIRIEWRCSDDMKRALKRCGVYSDKKKTKKQLALYDSLCDNDQHVTNKPDPYRNRLINVFYCDRYRDKPKE